MATKTKVQCVWCKEDNWVPREVTSTGYETRYLCWNCRGQTTQVWNIPKKFAAKQEKEFFELWKMDAKRAGVYDARIVEAMTNSKRVLMGDI